MSDFNVLIVDDDEIICHLICDTLKSEGINADFCLLGEESLSLLVKKRYEVVFLDLKLPDTDGFALHQKYKEQKLVDGTEVILITSHGDTKTGMEAVAHGFFDFIAKPFNVKELVFRVRRAKENALFREKIKKISKGLEEGFTEIIGDSKPMKEVFKLIRKVAETDSLVLIQGDTGTGKELVARAIHTNSSRKDNVFIPVNCGALSETLLENELFGHEKGAFTGAGFRKFGILETGDKGTVFLDEINSASPNVQTKLLRFFENGEFIRVGGTEPIKSNARVVVATNQDLKKLVQEGKFREDLFYRLDIIRIVLPTLQERPEDIPELVRHFQDMFNKKFDKQVKFLKSTVDSLVKQEWSGNIRQLKNFIHTLLLKNESGIVKPEDLDLEDVKSVTNESGIELFKEAKDQMVKDFEIIYLKKLLDLVKGNVLKASRVSGMSRKSLIDKLTEYEVDPKDYKKQ